MKTEQIDKLCADHFTNICNEDNSPENFYSFDQFKEIVKSAYKNIKPDDVSFKDYIQFYLVLCNKALLTKANHDPSKVHDIYYAKMSVAKKINLLNADVVKNVPTDLFLAESTIKQIKKATPNKKRLQRHIDAAADRLFGLFVNIKTISRRLQPNSDTHQFSLSRKYILGDVNELMAACTSRAAEEISTVTKTKTADEKHGSYVFPHFLIEDDRVGSFFLNSPQPKSYINKRELNKLASSNDADLCLIPDLFESEKHSGLQEKLQKLFGNSSTNNIKFSSGSFKKLSLNTRKMLKAVQLLVKLKSIKEPEDRAIFIDENFVINESLRASLFQEGTPSKKTNDISLHTNFFLHATEAVFLLNAIKFPLATKLSKLAHHKDTRSILNVIKSALKIKVDSRSAQDFIESINGFRLQFLEKLKIDIYEDLLVDRLLHPKQWNLTNDNFKKYFGDNLNKIVPNAEFDKLQTNVAIKLIKKSQRFSFWGLRRATMLDDATIKNVLSKLGKNDVATVLNQFSKNKYMSKILSGIAKELPVTIALDPIKDIVDASTATDISTDSIAINADNPSYISKETNTEILLKNEIAVSTDKKDLVDSSTDTAIRTASVETNTETLINPKISSEIETDGKTLKSPPNLKTNDDTMSTSRLTAFLNDVPKKAYAIPRPENFTNDYRKQLISDLKNNGSKSLPNLVPLVQEFAKLNKISEQENELIKISSNSSAFYTTDKAACNRENDNKTPQNKSSSPVGNEHISPIKK